MTDTLAFFDFETTGLLPADDHYPLEVAILFCRDEPELPIIGAYESLIVFDYSDLVVDEHMGAFQVNKLTLDELAVAPTHYLVASYIADLAKRCPGHVRLVSDNIAFDEAYMRRLFDLAQLENGNAIKWPFHYSSDDAGLLLRSVDIPRRKKPHRAMADVGGLYLDVLEARRRISQ